MCYDTLKTNTTADVPKEVENPNSWVGLGKAVREPDPSTYGGQLQNKLFDRRRKLRNDLREVEDALKTLGTDSTVQAVFCVIDVANK